MQNETLSVAHNADGICQRINKSDKEIMAFPKMEIFTRAKFYEKISTLLPKYIMLLKINFCSLFLTVQYTVDMFIVKQAFLDCFIYILVRETGAAG